jgi:hypothetical protein
MILKPDYINAKPRHVEDADVFIPRPSIRDAREFDYKTVEQLYDSEEWDRLYTPNSTLFWPMDPDFANADELVEYTYKVMYTTEGLIANEPDNWGLAVAYILAGFMPPTSILMNLPPNRSINLVKEAFRPTINYMEWQINELKSISQEQNSSRY